MRRNVGRLMAVMLALALVLSFGSLMESQAASKNNPCNPCAAKRMNPCNPCAAKTMNPCNPCNPCAAKRMNPCNPCAAKTMNPCNPCNPCAAKNPCNPCNPCAGGGRGPTAKARMVIAKVLSADAKRLAVEWQNKQLQISMSDKTQIRRGADLTSAADIKAGERIIVSMLDRGGQLSANYIYLAKAGMSGNPCNPCNPCAARRNPCNPCNPCAAKARMNPCNPCAMKKMNPCNPCATQNPCNPCGAKKKW